MMRSAAQDRRKGENGEVQHKKQIHEIKLSRELSARRHFDEIVRRDAQDRQEGEKWQDLDGREEWERPIGSRSPVRREAQAQPAVVAK
eukprot:365225-Pleurochrysis_carterae.AAC.2